jgi:hypothetical protein
MGKTLPTPPVSSAHPTSVSQREGVSTRSSTGGLNPPGSTSADTAGVSTTAVTTTAVITSQSVPSNGSGDGTLSRSQAPIHVTSVMASGLPRTPIATSAISPAVTQVVHSSGAPFLPPGTPLGPRQSASTIGNLTPTAGSSTSFGSDGSGSISDPQVQQLLHTMNNITLNGRYAARSFALSVPSVSAQMTAVYTTATGTPTYSVPPAVSMVPHSFSAGGASTSAPAGPSGVNQFAPGPSSNPSDPWGAVPAVYPQGHVGYQPQAYAPATPTWPANVPPTPSYQALGMITPPAYPTVYPQWGPQYYQPIMGQGDFGQQGHTLPVGGSRSVSQIRAADTTVDPPPTRSRSYTTPRTSSDSDTGCNPAHWRLRFNGSNVDLENYLAQFETVASRGNWHDDDMGSVLIGSLEGNATKVMSQLPRGCTSYNFIANKLRLMFAPEANVIAYRSQFQCRTRGPTETATEFSMALQELAAKGYPHMDHGTLQQMLVDQFIRGQPRYIKFALASGTHQTLEAVVAAGIRLETYAQDQPLPDPPRQGASRPQRAIRAAPMYSHNDYANWPEFEGDNAASQSGDYSDSSEVVSPSEDPGLEIADYMSQIAGIDFPGLAHARAAGAMQRGPPKCYFCQKPGHVLLQCRQLLQKLRELGYTGQSLPKGTAPSSAKSSGFKPKSGN